LGAAASNAAIVYFPAEDIPIPANFAGVSVDLETGATSTDLAGLPDGDANFFFGGAEITNDADAAAGAPSWQPVRTGTGNTDPLAVLANGVDFVDGTSTYGTGFGSSGDVSTHFGSFTAGQQEYIGFSLTPNGGGAELYGWMLVTLQTDASDLEGTIHSWAYEDQAGVPILVGAIPEPGSAALGLFGLAALALRRRRR
jgi:MYXO-CTERM domain-containing protein